MKNLTTHCSITETTATEVIFNACRANAARAAYGDLASMLTVTFTPTPVIGGHEAVVRDLAGIVVALANVDEFDI